MNFFKIKILWLDQRYDYKNEKDTKDQPMLHMRSPKEKIASLDIPKLNIRLVYQSLLGNVKLLLPIHL